MPWGKTKPYNLNKKIKSKSNLGQGNYEAYIKKRNFKLQ